MNGTLIVDEWSSHHLERSIILGDAQLNLCPHGPVLTLVLASSLILWYNDK